MRGDLVVATGAEADEPDDIDIEQTAYIPNELGTHELLRMAWGTNRRAVVSITITGEP